MNEQEASREMNALTVMPLPVKIPASWYDVLPKVLPLVRLSSAKSKFFIADDIIELFSQRWDKILIRRDGSFVWLHLGGVACCEIIPNFVREVKHRIDGRDNEIKEKQGKEALIQHWRDCIEEMQHFDDDTVLNVRKETLSLLNPDMWHRRLSKSWGYTAEKARVNFCNIRPIIKKWISKYGSRCNLDEPFGGRLVEMDFPASGDRLS